MCPSGSSLNHGVRRRRTIRAKLAHQAPAGSQRRASIVGRIRAVKTEGDSPRAKQRVVVIDEERATVTSRPARKWRPVPSMASVVVPAHAASHLRTVSARRSFASSSSSGFGGVAAKTSPGALPMRPPLRSLVVEPREDSALRSWSEPRSFANTRHCSRSVEKQTTPAYAADRRVRFWRQPPAVVLGRTLGTRQRELLGHLGAAATGSSETVLGGILAPQNLSMSGSKCASGRVS